MRDPEGELSVVDSELIRHLYYPLDASHFLYHSIAQSFVADGILIPFEFVNPVQIKVPLIEFVTMPHEWTDAQLRVAADLTLDISRKLFLAGFELKDASAWNIIFDGTCPRFCDHLSFCSIHSDHWWAFGQFVRHFIFSLGVSDLTGMRINKIFRCHRDGFSLPETRDMLGLRRFGSRLWPLLIDFVNPQASRGCYVSGSSASGKRTMHGNLYNFCAWSLGSYGTSNRKNQYWQTYTKSRLHYSDAASRYKRQKITDWLKHIQPQWVVDLGCNTGEYSQLAMEVGARVIAIDSDHDCIEQLFMKNPDNRQIHPLIANFSDLMGGSGWCGKEFPGLMARLEGKADILMMLALLHHLAVSESIPWNKIAEIASIISKKYLIVEFIGTDDLLMQRLVQQRNRILTDFSVDKQKHAFSKYFTSVADFPLAGTSRSLALMKKI